MIARSTHLQGGVLAKKFFGIERKLFDGKYSRNFGKRKNINFLL